MLEPATTRLVLWLSGVLAWSFFNPWFRRQWLESLEERLNAWSAWRYWAAKALRKLHGLPPDADLPADIQACVEPHLRAQAYTAITVKRALASGHAGWIRQKVTLEQLGPQPLLATASTPAVIVAAHFLGIELVLAHMITGSTSGSRIKVVVKSAAPELPEELQGFSLERLGDWRLKRHSLADHGAGLSGQQWLHGGGMVVVLCDLPWVNSTPHGLAPPTLSPLDLELTSGLRLAHLLAKRTGTPMWWLNSRVTPAYKVQAELALLCGTPRAQPLDTLRADVAGRIRQHLKTHGSMQMNLAHFSG